MGLRRILMKKYLLVFLTLASLSARAGVSKILGAYIDGARGVMVLTVLGDCNAAGATTSYRFSNKRIDGPHYYHLEFISTLMGCPKDQPRVKTFYVKLPE